VDYCHKTLDKVSLQIEEIDGRLAAREEPAGGEAKQDDAEEQE